MHTYTHTNTYTPIMFTSTGRSLGAISRRKERRMGEDGRRKERHIKNGGWEGGTGGEGWSHEQGEAERRAWMPAGPCLAREGEKSLHGYLERDRKMKVYHTQHLVRLLHSCTSENPTQTYIILYVFNNPNTQISKYFKLSDNNRHSRGGPAVSILHQMLQCIWCIVMSHCGS